MTMLRKLREGALIVLALPTLLLIIVLLCAAYAWSGGDLDDRWGQDR